MTDASDIFAVCQLAENLEQFDFIPDIHTPEEYGRYMIQKSGHFEYDANLEGFYDYRRYGEDHVREKCGQFNEYGYVAYHGTLTLDELMRTDPAEQYQQEQGVGMQMAQSEDGKRRGKLRRQEIEIYYSFVGKMDLPED